MQSGGSSVVVVVVQLSVQVSVQPLSQSVDAVAEHELSHSEKISATQELSTATSTHSVMHSWVGRYSQPASPDRKMPPHASSSACAVEGASAQADRTHNDEKRRDRRQLIMKWVFLGLASWLRVVPNRRPTRCRTDRIAGTAAFGTARCEPRQLRA
jgi:hypothetical protein